MPRPSNNFHQLFIALCVVLLAGCSTPVVKTTQQLPAGWSQLQQSLAAIQNWQINGKLGVRQDDRIDSAVINDWRQQGEHFDINLSSAVFGLGATNLKGTPDGIWLTQSGKDPVYSDQPERLIAEKTGWELPIRSIFYWIKGIPAPTAVEDMRFDEAGRLHQLKQSGWDIQYEDYYPATPYALPRKIVIQREHIRLILIINQWQSGRA